MDLSSLKPPKGQKSISGYSQMRGFEGGQMPLHRRLPKRGFTNIFKKEYAVINIGRFETLEGDSFDPAVLRDSGAIRKSGKDGIKILADGDLTRKISVKVHAITEAARKKIEAAGGTVELIPAPAGGPKPRKDGKGKK